MSALNPFVCYLMSVYEIRTYIDISSIIQRVSTVKQTGDKFFLKNIKYLVRQFIPKGTVITGEILVVQIYVDLATS